MNIIFKDKEFLPSPTVRQYYTLKYPEKHPPEDVMSVIEELTDAVETWNDLSEFLSLYIWQIDEERSKNPDLIVPYAPPEKKYKRYYNCDTADIKQVSDYTGLNFSEVYALDIFVFWGYLHDLVVWECEQTEKGRKYLENAHNYEQTTADRAALREIFGGKEEE